MASVEERTCGELENNEMNVAFAGQRLGMCELVGLYVRLIEQLAKARWKSSLEWKGVKGAHSGQVKMGQEESQAKRVGYVARPLTVTGNPVRPMWKEFRSRMLETKRCTKWI